MSGSDWLASRQPHVFCERQQQPEGEQGPQQTPKGNLSSVGHGGCVQTGQYEVTGSWELQGGAVRTPCAAQAGQVTSLETGKRTTLGQEAVSLPSSATTSTGPGGPLLW